MTVLDLKDQLLEGDIDYEEFEERLGILQKACKHENRGTDIREDHDEIYVWCKDCEEEL